jgi:secretion/DNA translocation related CpaE-like protein
MQATSELGEPGLPDGAGTAAGPYGPRGRRGGVPLVAVVGGCGGAGASTLAVCLAVAALELGRSAVLFDADALGGGLDHLLAAATDAERQETGAGERDAWPHDAGPPRRRRPGGRTPRGRLALVTWALHGGGNIPVAGMRNALRELRAGTDLVVVDLPRALDDAAQLALSEATHSLVVAPVSERAAVATARLLPKLTAVGPQPELVARLPARDELTPREFADLLVLPLAGVVRPRRGHAASPPDPLGRLAGRSAVSLERFSRRFVERCEATRHDSLNLAGAAA